ncbi:MAG: type II toxin-antitoxin system VapC family toxin [Dermatophilaceae bacterium]
MLLDSHVVLAALTDHPRMGSKTRDRVDSELALVSAVTTWELTIKAMTGRFTPEKPLGPWLDEAGFRHLPVLVEHGLRIGEVEGLPHGDPFDRLLLTQALVEGVDFLTWDRQILAAGLQFVRDARD